MLKGLPRECNITEWSLKGMLSGSDVFTKSIKSCTGGGVVDETGALKKELHIEDLDENIKSIPQIIANLGSSFSDALLIGQKKVVNYKTVFNKEFRRPVLTEVISKQTEPLFEGLKSELQTKAPVSYFQGHQPLWESHIYHSDKDKTWFVCTQEMDQPNIFVKCKEDLNKVFEKWAISDKSQLDFEQAA